MWLSKNGIVDPVEHQSITHALVGRSDELATLDGALQRALAGDLQGVLIGGEAGIGKTTLLREFLARAQETGAVTVLGNCLDVGAEGLPYAPLVTALHRLHQVSGAAVERAAEGYEEQLACLMPDLGGPGSVPDGPYGRAQLFEYTARFVDRLAADRPMVLAIDDMHWSDCSTRDLIAYLMRTLHPAPLMLVATFRTDDLHRRHPLRPYLAELERLPTVQRLKLHRFVRREVEQQLAGLPTPVIDRDVAARIYRRSDGNPFLVEELAHSHHDTGAVGLSRSLRDILMVRVKALPQRAQHLVMVAAVAGTVVEHGLLAAVSGLSENDVLEALRATADSQVLVPEGHSHRYRFRHALTREAVLDGLLPAERSHINRRYALALEQHPTLVRPNQWAGRLASHWYHTYESARALPAALEAARRAKRSNAFAEQLLMLERALELWVQVPQQVINELQGPDLVGEAYPGQSEAGHRESTEDCSRFVDLLADATIAATRSGNPELSIRFAETASRLLDDEAEPERAAWFWLQRARAAHFQDRTGEEESDRARQLVEDRIPTAVQADVFHQVSMCGVLTGPTWEHVTLGERAVSIAREVGARAVELNSLNTVGMLRVFLGDIEEGLSLLHEVCVQSAGCDDALLQARAYGNLASIYEQLGKSVDSVKAARKALDVTRQYGINPAVYAAFVGNLAEPLLSLGRHQEAEELLSFHLEQTGNMMGSDQLTRLHAEIALLRGNAAEAADYAARLTNDDLFRQYQDILPCADLAIRIATHTERYDEARTELLGVIGEGLPSGFDHLAWPLLVHGAGAEADSRGRPDADAGRTKVLELIQQEAQQLTRTVPLYEAWARMLDAELARAEERSTPELWSRAVEALRLTERPRPLAYALFQSATSLAANGSREEAGQLLREARDQARVCGDAVLENQVTAVSEQTWMPQAPSVSTGHAQAKVTDPSVVLGLTARERDVLHLLTLGRTNRQIAAELYISPKTASVHVSNILSKLQVDSRMQAAATADRMRLFLSNPPHLPS